MSTRKRTSARRTAGRSRVQAPKRKRAGARSARTATARTTRRATGARAARSSAVRSAAARRRRVRPTPPPAFAQRAGASPRQLVLFELMRARTVLHAALQGLTASAGNVPMAPGKWSVRQVILHLVTRDRARLREFESTLRGTQASWQGVPKDTMNRLNAELLESLEATSWDDALRLLHTTRQHLVEAIESVPEEPAERWLPEHPFGWMLSVLPPHDRHHAEAIKLWRKERRA